MLGLLSNMIEKNSWREITQMSSNSPTKYKMRVLNKFEGLIYVYTKENKKNTSKPKESVRDLHIHIQHCNRTKV